MSVQKYYEDVKCPYCGETYEYRIDPDYSNVFCKSCEREIGVDVEITFMVTNIYALESEEKEYQEYLRLKEKFAK